MQLAVVRRGLAELDAIGAEIVACAVFSDRFPMRGLAGLLDWRFATTLSAIAKSRFLSGAPGECLLVPGKPWTTFDKILLVGVGSASSLTSEVVDAFAARVFSSFEGFKAKRAVVDFPDEAATLERLVELTRAQASACPSLDACWIVRSDSSESIEERMPLRRVAP